MEKQQTAGTEPAIFVRNEETKSWEIKTITTERTASLGQKVLSCIRNQRAYAYTDALASAILLADHILR